MPAVHMLARLLRFLYLTQVLGGAMLGAIAATPGWALAGMALGALLLPLSVQFMVIAVSMLRSRGDAPLALWWRAFWGEFRAAVTVFVFRLPWAGPNPGVLSPLPAAAPEAQKSACPVLLVHGYICNHRIWDDVTLALRQAGHPVLMLDLEPLFTSIDNYVALIETAVTGLQKQTGAAQVALVGHSMGGLAIRAWMRVHGTSRVARIVTLGTPHQGTHIARSYMAPNVAQMVWHSAWLQALAQSESQATRQLIRMALTRQDNVVYPQREQVLAGATVTEFSGIGHVQMCLDQSVIAWLVQQLARR